jgi:hypothetical protein
LPIVEPTIVWGKDAPAEIGPYLFVELSVTNRLDETLLVERATVRKPRGAPIAIARRVRDRVVPERGAASSDGAGPSRRPIIWTASAVFGFTMVLR